MEPHSSARSPAAAAPAAAPAPATAAAPRFLLDRREAVPALIGRHEDFLILTGLAGTARDVAALGVLRAVMLRAQPLR